MPLPDAVPKPAGSNIYRQLSDKKLGELTNEEYEVVYNNIFLNDTSEDELRRLALIGLARQSLSASSSGPLVNSGKVATYLQSDASTSPTVRPPKGEVWQIIAISISNSASPSGSSSYQLYLSDAAMLAAQPEKPSANNDLYYSQTSSGSTNIPWESLVEDHNAQPFILTNEMFLRPYNDFAGMATGATTNWNVAYVVLR